EYEADPCLSNIFQNVLIRTLESEDRDNPDRAFRSLHHHLGLIGRLPFSPHACEVINADARASTLPTAGVDLVITSPPYINVFNYHQNSRVAMELLGWDVLRVARSEFGANRKHRANRFLTVVQYCLDMAETLGEMKRVLRPSARAILIVGRESNVRGVSFRNGSMVACLAALTGFDLATRQERRFTNKFGATIYEDILHLLPTVRRNRDAPVEARALAVHLLEQALAHCPDEDARQDIHRAIDSADTVEPSPRYVASQRVLV
ncbi:MAG: DNA methyltransferase, partial [Phycisphaerae bacterium]|nr:DNA methyltransferase [Phycisphaerae bacterium]